MISLLIDQLKIYGPKLSFKLVYWELRRLLGWSLLTGSYSQGGEDVVVDDLLGNKRNGFYVDVGAHDPNRYSNTKRFYLKGWRGINVEPDPGRFKKFFKFRKKDINLNIGIGPKEGMLNFYRMYPSPLSTFSKTVAQNYQKSGNKLLGTEKITVMPLAKVLEKQKVKNIDFLSVDVEGYDLHVLKSNDWQRFRPKVVILETGGLSERISGQSEVTDHEKFILSKSYKKVYDNDLNSIFVSTK